MAIKGQVLADFLAEGVEEGKQEEIPGQWVIYVDGASCGAGAGAGLHLVSPTGEKFAYAIWFEFLATNNEAEYEALIAGMSLARKLGLK
ncbi:UNVERIFIED_CONTAM: reverse transcriptase-like protein, partial [Salmonella enterica subsp. enterica serovar Weltevreden]